MLTRPLILLAVLLAPIFPPVQAGEYRLISEDPVPDAFAGTALPRSAAVIDDAALRDADSVGDLCWAVGDHGVVLRSADQGATWSPGILPFECSLTSVCFLTNQIGFIAGLQLDPFSGMDRGVLLITRDGGTTWSDVSTEFRLPGLRYVRFFGLKQGVVVTTPDEDGGGSILLTRDGGISWKKLESDAPQSDWVNAAFQGLAEGLIVGGRLSWGLVNNDRVQTLGIPRQTLQTVHSVSLSSDGRAWLAGDGGFVRRSTNRGVSWKSPATRFPPSIRDVFSFNTVVHDGDRVCVAGTPAACVLQSEDAGTTWNLVPCAERGSVHRLVRIGPDSLLAVGSWGMILKSTDFGRSWKPARHQRRRSSLLYLVSDPDDAEPLLLAQVSAEDGYRVSVVQPSQQRRKTPHREHWRTALSQLGANSFTTDWRFDRTRRQHGLSQAALLQSWQAASDGRLRDLLPLRLAVQIRTWQPDVICTESTGQHDATAAVWDSAIEIANAIAAGQDPRSKLLDDAGLKPWSAGRIVRRSHTEHSSLEFQADTLLPRLRTTAGLLADAWYRHAADASLTRPDSVAYALHPSQDADSFPERMFHGFAIRPGSEGRRALAPLTPGFEELQKTVNAHHTQKSAVTGHVDREPLGTALIAHTRTIGRPLPDALAKEQLLHMLALFRERENLECRIAVQQELTHRFPASPEAAQAADELHLLYSSAELLTLRKRDRATLRTQPKPGIPLTDGSKPMPEAVRIPGQPLTGTTVKPWALPGAGTKFGSVLPPQGTEKDALTEHWNQQAEVAWTRLQELAPAAAQSARHLLIQAARYRRLGRPGQERTLLASAASSADSHRLLAANEMQTTFRAMEPTLPDFKVPRGRERPLLDGLLSDVCWQHSPEISIQDSEPGDQIPNGLIMLSWDEEFLFIAGRLPLATSDAPPEEAFDRQHDEADITGDHIEFVLDVDRDYSSAWHFVIDSAGRTSDRCWQITRWDPEWFVATQRDSTGWRFEAAIPVEELREEPLAAGDRWAVSIRRIVPGFADQSVPLPENARELNHPWSIVRFIRNRRPQQ